jgi:hypothetical protein
MKSILKYFLVLVLVNISLFSKDFKKINESEIIRHADGSMTIIAIGVNERGNDIKRVTNIRVTEYLDGAKLVVKTVKIYDLNSQSEVLSQSYVQTNYIRPKRRSYNAPKNDQANQSVASPDGT